MKSTILTMTLVTASLLGCAKNSEESRPAPENPKAMKIVTDTSICGRGRAARGLDGTWVSDQMSVDGQLRFQMRFTFQGQRLTLSNTCAMAGRSLVASVTVPVSASDSEVRVLREGYDVKRIDESGFNLKCHVSAAEGSMPYQISGACLKFVDPKSKQELVLVPADVVDSPTDDQPEPIPQPVPQPQPQPQPLPFPQPRPQPEPVPAPVNGWSCLERNSLTNQVFIGFGPTLEIAKSSVKQECRTGPSTQFCEDQAIDCSKREGFRESWFCELTNTLSNEVFSSRGWSRVEATFGAQKACVSGQSPQFCETGAAVKCSRF